MDANPEPLEILPEDITAGMKNERKLILESANDQYNGKMIRIRSLRGREFRAITKKVRVGREDLAGNFELAMEACKLGIITPGIAARLEDMDHDVILQIGEAIIAASEPKEKEVEDFSGARRGN